MILKIVGKYGENKYGYYIFDNIDNIYYFISEKSKFGKGMDRRFEYDENLKQCIVLVIEWKDKSQSTFISDTTTYIMNDDGKTIEKLYVTE